MGSKHSKGKRHEETAKYGEIVIKTDKAVYFGGETVSGEIHLNLLIPYPGKQLFLKFKGKENVDYLDTATTTVGHNQTVSAYHNHKDNVIVNTTTQIRTWDSLLPGQYVLPFTIVIPPNLPSSFHHQATAIIANISYRLEAFLQPDDPKTDYKLKDKHCILIKAPVSNALQGSDKQVTTDIKKCGLKKKGSNVLTAHLEKNWYLPGEAAAITVVLDNTQCKLRNKHIYIRLKQYVTVQQGSTKITRDYIKAETELAGVDSGYTNGKQTVLLKIPQIQYKDYSELKEPSINIFQVREDKDTIGSTTNGSIITSEYALEILCKMKGPKSTKPTLSLPIQIYYPDSQPETFKQPQMDSRQGFGNVDVNLHDVNRPNIMYHTVPNC